MSWYIPPGYMANKKTKQNKTFSKREIYGES